MTAKKSTLPESTLQKRAENAAFRRLQKRVFGYVRKASRPAGAGELPPSAFRNYGKVAADGWVRVSGSATTELRRVSPAGVVYTIARYDGQSRLNGKWRLTRSTEEETLHWCQTLKYAKQIAELHIKQEGK